MNRRRPRNITDLGTISIMSFGRGILLGLVFFLPGVFAVTQWEKIHFFFDEISEIPIINEVSRDFSTGTDVFGKMFRNKSFQFHQTDSVQTIQEYMESNDFLVETLKRNASSTEVSPKYNEVLALTVWDRKAIEKKLGKEFSRRRMKQVGPFLDYIEEYIDMASKEMVLSHIPASISLGQGILESNAGRSFLAKRANNHFGIKCVPKRGYRKDGKISDKDFMHHNLSYDCQQRKDDYEWDRFEMYTSPELSYRRHSRLLANNARYNWMVNKYVTGELYKVPKKWFGVEEVPYYAAWSIGLKKSGYATNKKYAQKLALIIETYELWRIDYNVIINGNKANQLSLSGEN